MEECGAAMHMSWEVDDVLPFALVCALLGFATDRSVKYPGSR